MIRGHRVWLVVLVGAVAVLVLAIWLSHRVLVSTPTSKATRKQSARVYCELNELPYSEGAIVKTAHGVARCHAGKWVAFKNP
jgi:hypothetical protein